MKLSSMLKTTSEETRFGYWVWREERKRRTRVKSPSRNSWRMVRTAVRKVCSPPRKVVFVGSDEEEGAEARL